MDWVKKHRITNEELEKQIQQVRKMKDKPLVSILVPTFNTPEAFLKQMLDSVLAQTYDKWELCIADASNQYVDESQSKTVVFVIKSFCRMLELLKIRIRHLLWHLVSILVY